MVNGHTIKLFKTIDTFKERDKHENDSVTDKLLNGISKKYNYIRVFQKSTKNLTNICFELDSLVNRLKTNDE